MTTINKVIIILFVISWNSLSISFAVDKSKFDFKKTGKVLAQQEYYHCQGLTAKLYMGNRSTMGIYSLGESSGAPAGSGCPPGFGLEYPLGSKIEHLFGAGPWIGAIVDTASRPPPVKIKVVTTGYEGWSGPLWEMFGNPNGRDSFFVTSIDRRDGRNRRDRDDDGDELIDEDELDGIDNDGDGLIDEDFGAVSERDVYVSYADYYGTPAVTGHIPLGIRVWQRSFSWRSRVKEPILPFEFYFINDGPRMRRLDSVWVGFFADCDVGPITSPGYYTRNFSGYLADVRTAYVHNPVDKPTTPIGITVLGAPKPLDLLRYTFQWYPGQQSPTPDAVRYEFMSSGIIKPDEYPNVSDTRFHFAFGPFDSLVPGESLRIAVAIVLGSAITEGHNNIRDNAARAIELYERGWTAPPVPPSPCLRIYPGDYRVTLKWDFPASRDTILKYRCNPCNPLEIWDDSSRVVDVLPDTHWRRKDPHLRCDTMETGGVYGGRIFEGFRVWRSEAPDGNPRSFALLKQYDVDDDMNIEYGTGLKFELVDSNLVRGRRYWYAVTSFSIPGITLVQIPDTATGEVYIDTLMSPPTESSIDENKQLVILPFEPSYEVGKVRVVPNPYRTDVDYTYEAGGWEGLGRYWDESKRVIWFIHLPPKCTIRIFSLTGDLVATIEHDDEYRASLGRPDLPAGQEEWNLVSQSGRAIASGVYVYTVESDYGRQIGKFVVIR